MTGTATGRVVRYSYDDDGRLIAEDDYASSTSENPGRTYTYTYDLAGNRLTLDDLAFDSSGNLTSESHLVYSYDAADRLRSTTGGGSAGTSYEYDLAGNTIAVTANDATTQYTWDVAGRMIHVVKGVGSTVHDTYDDAGIRTSETVDGTKTTFLNDPNNAYDQVLEEYAPGGALAVSYVRGLDLLFQDRGGTRSFYVKDGSGSTRALTNAAGVVTDTYTYEAYGNLNGSTGVTTNEFLYAGYQNDAAVGLNYLRARYLDAAVGRFTSRDSFGGLPEDPITQNHYLYANANPVDYIDLNGHEGELANLVTAIGIGSNVVSFANHATKILTARTFEDAAKNASYAIADLFSSSSVLRYWVKWTTIGVWHSKCRRFKSWLAKSVCGMGHPFSCEHSSIHQ